MSGREDELISREMAIGVVGRRCGMCIQDILDIPSAQTEIIRCRECKYWKQQTNYAGTPLSFGFCESDDMWRSLYGERDEIEHIDTDDDFYCGFAERREE